MVTRLGNGVRAFEKSRYGLPAYGLGGVSEFSNEWEIEPVSSGDCESPEAPKLIDVLIEQVESLLDALERYRKEAKERLAAFFDPFWRRNEPNI